MVNEITLFVQPAYNYSTSKVEYAEVLIRNYRGLTKVPDILNFVKDNHIEEEFDMDVLRETLRVVSETPELDYPIGVNLCSETIKKEGIASKVIGEINKFNVNHRQIVIEVNEETNFCDKVVINNIEELRKNNIKIALDDFGVKNSNLLSLMNAKIDILKVDRAFIDTTTKEKEESQHEILKLLIQLCNNLNLKHIVEGVETNRQLNHIQNLGYSVVQGYLYERPVPFVSYMKSAS